MKTKVKLTTRALTDEQHLVPVYPASFVEWFCRGYSNGRRDKSLDGVYYSTELKKSSNLN